MHAYNFGEYKNELNSNGCLVRTVLINSSNMKYRSVTRADKRDLSDERSGTYQECKVGDYAIYYDTKDKLLGYRMVSEDNGDPVLVDLPSTVDMSELIELTTPIVNDWLKNSESNPWLPANVGWDGVYSSKDLEKRAIALHRIPARIDGELLDRIVRAVYYTPKNAINVPTVHFSRKHNPIYTVEEDVDFIIEEYEDGKINVIDCSKNPSRSFTVREELVDVIIIKFNQLKVKGNEQLYWSFLKFI